MKRWILILCNVSLIAACGSGEQTKLGNQNNETVTKEEARANGGKDEEGVDLCDFLGWYGDNICDDFCPNPDPDCDVANNTSTNNTSTNNASTNNASTNNGTNNTSTNNGTNNTSTNNSTNNTSGGDCGGFAGLQCADTEWCSYADDAMCGAADQLGTCQPRPEECTRIYQPVCGCDGSDYSNECTANAAGVSVASAAECGAATCSVDADCMRDEGCVNGVCESSTRACGGFAGLTCGTGEFCDYALGDICGAADALGTCTALPQVCPDVFAPVCGCDGATYSNSCDANAAGTAVASAGECKVVCANNAACGAGELCINGYCEDVANGVCGGIAGFVCDATEWCDYPDNSMCGAGDVQGTCQPRPDACLQVFDPVCGCDGQTHSNGCMAHAVGVDVFTQGACPN